MLATADTTRPAPGARRAAEALRDGETDTMCEAIAGVGGAPCSIANPHDAVGSRRNSRFATALNRLPPTMLALPMLTLLTAPTPR